MFKKSQCDACCDSTLESARRRDVIKAATVGIAGLGLVGAEAMAADEAAGGSALKAGDLLVSDDTEAKPVPLTVADLKPGKPVLAFPYDAQKNVVRSDSRLNKVLLLRIDDADAASAKGAVNGVLAFSAICTHQACEVKSWMAKQKVLSCYCHGSLFQPLDGGAVVGGPAPRPLPTLPIKVDNGKLVIAGPFSAAPGGAAS